ncbi:hypothetical protein [Streptomyces flaveolus]|uniref:hypothetical protein n=1 Tax=Streptomyces flaveolus TaxID=67297 RepID=UPI0033349CD5
MGDPVEATGREMVIIAAVTNAICLSFRSLDVRGMPPRSSALCPVRTRIGSWSRGS